MGDWETVAALESWKPGARQSTARCQAEPNFGGSPKFAEVFPNLHELLSTARCTRVHLKEGQFLLFAWGGAGLELRAWLAPEVRSDKAVSVWRDHQILLEEFGGIYERYNEPEENWLLCHNEAWTADIAECDVNFIHDFEWMFEKVGGVPIDTSEFYQMAYEANGNCVFCSRTSGRIVSFAPYGSNFDLIPLEGSPGDTLYTYDQAPDFRSWVECIAAQWKESIR